MPAITDLTWQQLDSAFEQLGVATPLIVDSYGNVSGINIAQILGSTVPVPTTGTGIIKLMQKLLEACRIAQEAANTGQPAGERLAAFPLPVTGAAANGLVPVTRSVAGRVDISSATVIIGTNV